MNARFSFVVLIFFAVVTVRGEEPAPAPAENPLGAARRDLRDLSATEKSRESSVKLPGSASVPMLAIPSSSEVAPSKPDESAPSSPTWLLEALAQTDAERGQRRGKSDATSARPLSDGARKNQPTDPLAQYLGQWMTPRDLSLLRPEVATTTQSTSKSLDVVISQRADPTGLSGMQQTSSPFAAEPAKNPYLQEPEVPNIDATAVHGANWGLVPARSQPAGGPALQTAELPPRTDLRKTPAATVVGPAEVSPAAPIINSGKYFPQLRRF